MTTTESRFGAPSPSDGREPMDGDQSSRRAPRVVALTGARGPLGRELIRELEADPDCRRVVAFDLQEPPGMLGKTRFFKVDLTLPGADTALARGLREEEVDTFVHLAFLSGFTHRFSWAHELESIGTMRVLNACTEAAVSKVVLWSHTYCYGANPQNPAYLREESPLAAAARPNDTFFSDKIDAERQVGQFAEEHPDRTVTVLRMAPILAPGVDNFIRRLLTAPAIPVLFGHDPLLQLLHLSDGVRALRRVVLEDHPGVFNIAADGVVPLRTAIALLGRLPVPVPSSLARRLAGALWMGQVIDVPPSLLDYLRYPCVVDTKRARRKLRFFPAHDIHEVLAEMAGLRDTGDGRPREGEKWSDRGQQPQAGSASPLARVRWSG